MQRDMKNAREPELAALLGDVRRSRAFSNQRDLLDTVFAALQWANSRVPAAQPLEPTQGDGFQGAYATVAGALHATLLLRLYLWNKCDLRFGIGWGSISRPAAGDAGQSGTAWWEARSAIDEVMALESGPKSFPTGIRTLFRGGERQTAALANAYLICRDDIVRRFDAKDARITLGLFLDENQSQLASALGVTQSSISARQRRNGPLALFRAHQELRLALGEAA